MKVVFAAHFHGTCCLCWEPISPGDMLVLTGLEHLGNKWNKFAHASCYKALVESTDDIDLTEHEEHA